MAQTFFGSGSFGVGRASESPVQLLLLEGIAGAAETEESVGVMQAGAPVTGGVGEFLLGHEKSAFPALELFLVDFVVAGFGEGRERMLHFSLPCNVAMRARCCQPQVAALYGIRSCEKIAVFESARTIAVPRRRCGPTPQSQEHRICTCNSNSRMNHSIQMCRPAARYQSLEACCPRHGETRD